jgi:amino acid transporter
MTWGQLEHTLLPKSIALPVFSSDALSSVAYATQEILLVLVGAAALSLVVPISLAVATLLAMVVVSYRQTVRAYPSGGGAYIVAHENLGQFPGLLAASALLIDYILTVSVSVVAGVDAIVSASPGLANIRVEMAVFFVALVALANLRGVRESGTIFAIPTYGFILSIYALILTGLVKCLGGCPQAASHDLHPVVIQGLTLFVVLRAFSAGTTALTGVEAISNGVPAFRPPQSKNAATTLAIMGAISISMFLGISTLAHLTHVVYTDGSKQTVIAQIADAVFGHSFLFYVVQVMTASILFLAANTAFADFPRLSSILARDRFMPRQFMNRGDRLVFSNGIIVLAMLASLLVVAFRADLNHLIQLYLVGVFVSFTLSQSGMVVHWRKTREPNWRRSAIINGAGAVLTSVVLVVVVITKFMRGAWIVVALIPMLISLMKAIHRHYLDVEHQASAPERLPAQRNVGHQHMVLVVHSIDAATAQAVRYVRSIGAADIEALTFDDGLQQRWTEFAPNIPIRRLAGSGPVRANLKRLLKKKRDSLSPDDFLTVVIPEPLASSSLFEVLKKPALQALKASLVGEEGIQVMDVPVVTTPAGVVDTRLDPARHYVCVLVRSVNNASLQAIEYAETLRPIEIRGVHFSLDPEDSDRLGDQWLAAGVPHPLEMYESRYRDIGQSVTEYVRRFNADGINTVVTVVVPEWVVPKRRYELLHRQTALIVKRHLLFEPGVVVVSVPYQLARGSERRARAGK